MLGVGDDQHLGVERTADVVERHQHFALPGSPDTDLVAGQSGVVEGVQRMAELAQNVVGRVDNVVHRSQADRLEPVGHPGRALTHRGTLDDPGVVPAAQIGVFDGDRGQVRGIGRVIGLVEISGVRAELVTRCRGDLPCDAVDVHAVGAVREDLDLEEVVVSDHLDRLDRQTCRRQPARQLFGRVGELDELA